MERIITIGREYGSGGREIGRWLAEKLQFAFFDYQIVTELAKRTAFAEEYILSIQEKRPYPVLPVPTVRMWAPPNPMLDQHLEVFLKETNEALMFVDGEYSYPEIFCFGFDAIDGRPNQSYK